MEDNSTIARPYAIALFKLARQDDNFGLWSDMLRFLASVTADPIIKGIVADPRVEKERLIDLVIEIGGGRFNEQAHNLVRVLVENDRLDICDEIFRLFEQERASAEKRVTVGVISAYGLNPKFELMIAEAMRKRLGCEVELETRIDRSLIGGVIIRAGDLVIDASLKGGLRQLEVVLA